MAKAANGIPCLIKQWLIAGLVSTGKQLTKTVPQTLRWGLITSLLIQNTVKCNYFKFVENIKESIGVVFTHCTSFHLLPNLAKLAHEESKSVSHLLTQTNIILCTMYYSICSTNEWYQASTKSRCHPLQGSLKWTCLSRHCSHHCPMEARYLEP